jgi:hypothetical protein
MRYPTPVFEASGFYFGISLEHFKKGKVREATIIFLDSGFTATLTVLGAFF